MLHLAPKLPQYIIGIEAMLQLQVAKQRGVAQWKWLLHVARKNVGVPPTMEAVERQRNMIDENMLMCQLLLRYWLLQ